LHAIGRRRAGHIGCRRLDLRIAAPDMVGIMNALRRRRFVIRAGSLQASI
jgi:hypothetical protein